MCCDAACAIGFNIDVTLTNIDVLTSQIKAAISRSLHDLTDNNPNDGIPNYVLGKSMHEGVRAIVMCILNGVKNGVFGGPDQLAYAYLRWAQHVGAEALVRDLLAKAANYVGLARQTLELLHYPAKWRRAHELSAQIYEEMENNAATESERQDLRRLKERALLLSRTG